MKYLFTLLTVVSAFTLGGYASAQFKFNYTVDTYRWIITFICLLMWIALQYYYQNKDRPYMDSRDVTYDAECHVFKGIIKSTNTVVWQYFYADEDGMNQHSGYYGSRKEAIEAYIVRPANERGPQIL